MPSNKRKERAAAPEVEAVQMSEEDLAAAMPSLVRVPVAIAQPEQESQSSSRKGVTTSRVHEAFLTDPTNSSRCLCQSTENVVGGGVCNENVGKVVQTMWSHLKAKHPQHWEMLKGFGGNDAAGTSASKSAPEGGCSLACSAHISYKQMVEALSNAPPPALSWAIVALEEAEKRNEERFDSRMNEQSRAE